MHDDYQAPSKSQIKRDMEELQDLGEELVKLSNEHLRNLDLPEYLHDAVREAKRLTAWGAIRRQSQYIGRLMREIDPQPIREYLDRLKGVSDQHSAWLHQLERTRDRLLADDKALQEFIDQHPQVEVKQLRAMIRNARKERDEQKPPKHFRALFQLLKTYLPEPGLPGQRKTEPQESENDNA